MSYYERGNFLIIHGGHNDLNNDSFALNDKFIFDLEFLNGIGLICTQILKDLK